MPVMLWRTLFMTHFWPDLLTWRSLWLCGILLAGWAGSSSAFAKELIVAEGFSSLSLAGYLDLLDDPKGEFDFSGVLKASAQGQFNAVPGIFGRGYTTATSWLRIDLENSTTATQTPVLHFTPQMLDHLDLYVQQSGVGDSVENYRLYPLGDHTPASIKQQAHPFAGVPINLPSGHGRRVYLRVQTTSSSFLGLQLMTPDLFARRAVMTLIGVSGYEALAFGLALVTLIQAIRIKDLTHALYALLPLGLGLNSIGTEGMTAILLPGIAHRINDGLVGFSFMLIFGGLSLFAMRLFKTAQHHPWGHRYLQAVTLLAVAFFIASGTIWYGYIGTPLMVMGLFLWAFMTWAGWRMIKRGEKVIGRLFLVAFTLPLLGASVTLSRYINWLPQNESTQYLMSATSLIHMVLMNVALSERLLESETGLREAAQLVILEGKYRNEKEQLLTMISHEIRTPIAIIDASNQSLQVLDPSPVPERAERYERIARAVSRLGVLLDLTVVEGQINLAGWQPARNSVDSGSLCNRAVRVLDPPFAQRIQILSAESLPIIIGDERMLGFALLNLLDNACKYSPPDSPVRVSIATTDQGILWEVADQGPGIPSGMETRIFEKYTRISEACGQPGLGLGLHLSRQVFLAHGGWLRVKPDVAAGACFECWLPAAPLEGTLG